MKSKKAVVAILVLFAFVPIVLVGPFVRVNTSTEFVRFQNAEFLPLFRNNAPLAEIQQAAARTGLPVNRIFIGSDMSFRADGEVVEFRAASLLGLAVESRRVDVVSWLLAAGCNPNQATYFPPLHKAIAHDCFECAEELLSHGADPLLRAEATNQSALDYARRHSTNGERFVLLFEDYIDRGDGTGRP